MTTLFTNARLIDPEYKTDSPGCLLVQNGTIAEIIRDQSDARQLLGDRNISPEAVEIIDCENRCLAPGET